MNNKTSTRTQNRRLTLVALAATAALAIASAPLLAQHGDGHGSHHGREKMMERLFERLDLTADQKSVVHDIMKSHHEQTTQLREERTAGRRALGETIHADLFDEDAVRKAAADVAAIDADLAVLKAQMFQEISTVLTTEQQARMKELIEDWHFMADEFRGQRHGKGPRAGAID